MRRSSEGAEATPGPSVPRRRSARLASKQSSRKAIMEQPRLRSGGKARAPEPIVSETERSGTATNTQRKKPATAGKARLSSSGKTSSRGRTEQIPKGRAVPLKRTLPTKAIAKESSVTRPRMLLHDRRNFPSSSGTTKRPVRMRAQSRFSSSSSPSIGSSTSSGISRGAEKRRFPRSASSDSYRSWKRRCLPSSGSSSESSVPDSEAQRWLDSSSDGSGSCSSAEKQRRLRSGWTSSIRSSDTSAYRRRFLRGGSSSSGGIAKRAAKRQRRARGRPPSSRSPVGDSKDHLGARGPQLPACREQTVHEKVSKWLARMTEH